MVEEVAGGSSRDSGCDRPYEAARPGVAAPDAEYKLRDVQRIADAALHGLHPRHFLGELLDRVKEVLQADTAAVLLLDRRSRQLVATAASGIEEEVRQGVRIPVGKGFAGRIAAERRPVILDNVDHTEVLNPLLLDRGIRSLIGVPLVAGGAVLGVLHVGSVGSRTFTPDDATLLQFAADRAALAVQSVRHRADRAAAEALQHSLVPSDLPAVPGVEMAARYVPGDGNVGGDWYDVFRLPSGELSLVIGDVAGSGLWSAVVMGRMRSALRSYALETNDPAEVLRRLDRKIQYFETEVMATVLYAVFDLASHRLHISSAGHLPPVAAVPGHPSTLTDIAVDVPIGVADAARRRVISVPVTPGTLLCFYTDGLVERRGKPLDDGLALLCDAVTAEPPGTVCVSVMKALIGNEQTRDDVAMLLLRQLR